MTESIMKDHDLSKLTPQERATIRAEVSQVYLEKIQKANESLMHSVYVEGALLNQLAQAEREAAHG